MKTAISKFIPFLSRSKWAGRVLIAVIFLFVITTVAIQNSNEIMKTLAEWFPNNFSLANRVRTEFQLAKNPDLGDKQLQTDVLSGYIVSMDYRLFRQFLVYDAENSPREDVRQGAQIMLECIDKELESNSVANLSVLRCTRLNHVFYTALVIEFYPDRYKITNTDTKQDLERIIRIEQDLGELATEEYKRDVSFWERYEDKAIIARAPLEAITEYKQRAIVE